MFYQVHDLSGDSPLIITACPGFIVEVALYLLGLSGRSKSSGPRVDTTYYYQRHLFEKRTI
jgi:hypothetical protein